jgi:tetratricopeptide (TPR) repeat protein
MRRIGRIALGIVALAGIGAGVWMIVGESRINERIRDAVAALDADDADRARALLVEAAASRPESGEIQYLAARAARMAGDIAAARKHLSSAKRLGWVSEAIDLETGLIQAQTDSLAVEYDYHLRKCLRENHPDAKYIAQVLVYRDFANFQLADAVRETEIWTERAPNSVKAWTLRGEVCNRARLRPQAIEAFQKAHAIEPRNAAILLSLTRLMLISKVPPDNVAALLEPAHADAPDNVDIALQLAMCRIDQARLDDASEIVDRLLEMHKDSSPALQLRGRIELARDNPERALAPLRRAVELEPYQPDLLFSLLQALNRTGPPAEAATIEARWKKCKADLDKLSETTREIMGDPANADLRSRAGEICIRNGLEKEGVLWLESALRIAPDHAATHTLLAERADKAGDPATAARHRELARRKTSDK